MVNYVESPIDRIVDVNFGQGFVIAEVNDHYFYLASLTPADPNVLLKSFGAYAPEATIPEADYRLLLTTTANLTIDSTSIIGIANTSIPVRPFPSLEIGGIYPISGKGIPGGATMTYTGATIAGLGHGTLSAPATANTTAGAIAISMDWLFEAESVGGEVIIEYETLMDTSNETPLGYNVAYAYDGSVANREHTDVFYDAISPGDQSRYLATWFDSNIHTTLLFYNGQALIPQFGVFGFPPADFWPPHELNPVGGPIVATVLEVILILRELARSFIVLTDRAPDVAVMQKSLTGSRAFITPGYTGGVKLRGYPGGGTIVMRGDFHLEVRGSGGRAAPPAWVATVNPHDPPPLDGAPDLQVAHFGANGLL